MPVAKISSSSNNIEIIHSIIIKVKYHLPSDMTQKEIDAFKIEQTEIGDWIDLRCGKALDIKAGDTINIPLGISMELPKGYEAWIAPRSSTLANYGLIGIFGIIDNAYRGDNDIWHLLAYATRDTSLHIGDRIAQFRIAKNMGRIRFQEVDHLGNPDRGGLGSTGKI